VAILVSLTLATNLPLISTPPAVPVSEFSAGVVDTGGKFATSVVDTSGAPWFVNISTNFWKIFEMTPMLFSGAWEKMIHEKTEKTNSKKSRDTVPLIARLSAIR
jgi:hypothetical protein